MTPQERAEKIKKHHVAFDGLVSSGLVEAIAAEIQLAVQESYTLGWNEACREAKAFLRPEAYISARRMAYMNAEAQGETMSDLPEWAVKHKVFCDQCSDNCLLFQALSIAWEAMEEIQGSYVYDGRKVVEAMDRIRKLGEE